MSMMTEPVEAQQIMLAAMAGAMVVLFGAVYAFLFAWSKLHKRPVIMLAAYLSYLCLAAATVALAFALHLSGFWLIVVFVMLVGYLLAPHAIWHLCEGTHEPSTPHGTDEITSQPIPLEIKQ